MSIPGFLRTPFRWWWDAFLRITFLVLVCVAGLLVESLAWYAVFVGWGFVLFCFFAQKRYEKQQQMALLALDSKRLRNAYRNIEWLNWGLNGSFYKDLNESMALYIDQKPEEAEKVLARWDNFPGIPKSLEYLPEAYRTTGDHILMRWQKLIDDYEALVKEPPLSPQTVVNVESVDTSESGGALMVASTNESGGAVTDSSSEESSGASSESSGASIESSSPSSESELHGNVVKAAEAFVTADAAYRKARAQMMLLHVARAYAEQNRLTEAAQCLIDFKVASQASLNLQSLALTFLPFFALSGEMKKTETLLTTVKRPSLVDYILFQTDYCKEHAKYWLARCARRAGDEPKAVEWLKEARELGETELFRSRVDLQLSRNPEKASDTAGGAARIWRDFKAAEFVQDIFRPGKVPESVLALILLIVVTYVFTDLYAQYHAPSQLLTAVGDAITRFESGSLSDLQGVQAFHILMQKAKTMRDQVIVIFALIPPLVALSGEVWRLITYLFLHGHFTHMAFNVLGLFFFGRMAESVFGVPKFLTIFFLGGILSGVYGCVINFGEPVVGASGAIFAVFGAMGAATFRLKKYLPELLWRRQMSIMVALGCAQVLLDQANLIKNVAGSVHFGGLLAGALLGFVMPMNITKRYPAAQGNAAALDSAVTTEGSSVTTEGSAVATKDTETDKSPQGQ
jgi:Uncharacterized membrane protein (homolog of Drosophila rhomboid)